MMEFIRICFEHPWTTAFFLLIIGGTLNACVLFGGIALVEYRRAKGERE